jgi:hypothetical protein
VEPFDIDSLMIGQAVTRSRFRISTRQPTANTETLA